MCQGTTYVSCLPLTFDDDYKERHWHLYIHFCMRQSSQPPFSGGSEALIMECH